jgi:acetyl esterase/lipase
MSRLLRLLGSGATILAAAVLLAACSTAGVSSDSSTSIQPDPVTAQAATTTIAQPAPMTTTSAAPNVTTTIDAARSVTVVEGEPYRQPSDGDPSNVDIYLADGSVNGPPVVLLHGWGHGGPGIPAVDLGPFAEEIARLGSTVFYFHWDTNEGFSADSAADLRCIGGFVSARAAEYGSSPDDVVVIGHSMGGETGSMLALSSFGLTPGSDCVETGERPTAVAFLGTAGSYGHIAQPLDDDLTTFAVRLAPTASVREIAADEFATAGLTAADAYALDGNSALPSANPPRMVLLVGEKDLLADGRSSVPFTTVFAETLEAHGIDVEVVLVAGGNHDNVVHPDTDAGQTTLQTVADILNSLP